MFKERGVKKGPVLIAGDGRSGTTLLAVILDTHPNLSIGPELHFRAADNLGRYILDAIEINSRLSDDEWETYRHNSKYRHAFLFIQRVGRFGVTARRLGELIENHIQNGVQLKLFAERCQLVEDIVSEKQNLSGQKDTIWGFKIMRELPLFAKYLSVWPDAVFIHIVRDGRDVAASQMMDHKGWGYADIDEAAAGWCKMLKVAEDIPQEHCIQIRYEDLVMSPEDTMRGVCDFLKIEWCERFLRHHELESKFLENQNKHPSGEQVSGPISKAYIGRYKSELSSEQVKNFEKKAHTYMNILGYQCEYLSV